MSVVEIDRLRTLQKQHHLGVEIVSLTAPNFPLVRFSSNNSSWDIYVDDEYHFLKRNNELLNIFLVLNALEDYNYAEDYLQWCLHQGLNASNLKWLDYYTNLSGYFTEITAFIGQIEVYLPKVDYQLNPAAFTALFED